MMNSLLYQSRYKATLHSVSTMRKEMDRVLTGRKMSRPLIDKVLLCFSEAATNLIRHNDPHPSFLDAKLGCNHQECVLELGDDGCSWNPTTSRRNGLSGVFEEKESGRGLTLIHHLCDSMDYRARTDFDANVLTLCWQTSEEAKKPRILIVDDDASQRRLYSAYLGDLYTIIEADCGQQALARLNELDVDLVISDIRMPGMDGLDLKKQIHQHPDSELTPFIFLTYADTPAIKEDAVRLGIDDYLIKPVGKADLVNTIERILERSRQVYRQLTNRIDQRITRALAPDIPKESMGWKFAVATRTTGIGGGDLLLHRESGSALNLVLADVMGHDEAAKFFSYAFGGYLRGLMYHLDDAPTACAGLLEQLSDCALADGLLAQVTLTCCASTFYADGRLSVAAAGHPAPLLINEQGITPLSCGGILPGLLSDTRYKEQQTCLKPGERIAIYTDGLFESAEDNQARKKLEGAICQHMQQTLHEPLEQALESVISLFDELTGYPAKDDVTLVLLEYGGHNNLAKL